VSYSWLYFGRQNPLNPIGISANEECTHNDGMQIYAGGTQGPITFDHVIIGPGAMNGAILGEQNAAQVNDVTFSNVVCLDAEENCFIDNPGGNAQRWH